MRKLSNPQHLLKMFLDALERNSETLDDVIAISHPLNLLEDISTLEEIQCFYLHGAHGRDNINNPLHKHDMPFIAVTNKHIYYNDVGLTIYLPKEGAKNVEDYIADNIYPSDIYGVESYKRDD